MSFSVSLFPSVIQVSLFHCGWQEIPLFFLVGFLLLMYLSNLQGATQTFLVLYLLLTFDLPCVLSSLLFSIGKLSVFKS